MVSERATGVALVVVFIVRVETPPAPLIDAGLKPPLVMPAGNPDSLLTLKLTLGLVHALQVEPTFGAGIGAFFSHEFPFVALALIAYGACFWFARPRGPVDFTEVNAIDVESMGLYWHFVDIVWIVIFTAVYLLEYL